MGSDALYGLVLAGGESRRMGQDKALLVRDGMNQLEYVVSQLTAVTQKVFVSTRAGQQQEPERSRYEQIVDRYEDMGPIAGIVSAMEEYPNVDWLVVACDLPNIDVSTLYYLLANRSNDKPFTAFRSSHDDLPEPLCAVYTSASRVLIEQFIAAGINCPRKILIRADSCLLTQPEPTALDNINTPADLRGSVLEAAS
jgi:molybdopterin-guanine dinucleotide biosynthesis protein A